MVTINPAKQLKVDNRVGSLEVGKDADVVVWTHHPLSAYALADRVYIDGTLYYDRKADDLRLTGLKKEKAALGGRRERAQRRPTTTNEQPRQAPGGDEGDDEGDHRHDLAAGGGMSGGGTTPLQARPATPAVWAITNATIHPVTSATIERGTIVIRNGKIEAVGANVAVPLRRKDG